MIHLKNCFQNIYIKKIDRYTRKIIWNKSLRTQARNKHKFEKHYNRLAKSINSKKLREACASAGP